MALPCNQIHKGRPLKGLQDTLLARLAVVIVIVVILFFVFVPAFVFSVVMVIVVAPAVAVPNVLAVPVMVVFNSAAFPLPVAAVVMAALVARNDPDGALVRRTRPVAPVPGVAAVDRIPVAVHPG